MFVAKSTACLIVMPALTVPVGAVSALISKNGANALVAASSVTCSYQAGVITFVLDVTDTNTIGPTTVVIQDSTPVTPIFCGTFSFNVVDSNNFPTPRVVE